MISLPWYQPKASSSFKVRRFCHGVQHRGHWCHFFLSVDDSFLFFLWRQFSDSYSAWNGSLFCCYWQAACIARDIFFCLANDGATIVWVHHQGESRGLPVHVASFSLYSSRSSLWLPLNGFRRWFCREIMSYARQVSASNNWFSFHPMSGSKKALQKHKIVYSLLWFSIEKLWWGRYMTVLLMMVTFCVRTYTQ